MPYDDDIDFSIAGDLSGGDYRRNVGDFDPGSGNFSKRSCGIENVVSVRWDKGYPALLRFLGFSEVRGSQLHRVLPLRHASFDFLWCTKVVSFQDFAFKGKFETPDDDRPDEAEYQRTRMKLLYEQLPYALLDDDQIDTEADRYVDWGKYESSVDTLKADVGNFLFAEGPSTFVGKPYADSVAIIIPKGLIRATWYEVPHDWLFNSSGVPTGINKCVGKVNSNAFRGYDAGTLLLEPPLFDPYVMNLRTAGSVGSNLPALFYDVTLLFRHFDPPRYDETSPYKGHNLVPLPRSSKFVLATRDGTTGGDGRYLMEDFSAIFAQAF